MSLFADSSFTFFSGFEWCNLSIWMNEYHFVIVKKKKDQWQIFYKLQGLKPNKKKCKDQNQKNDESVGTNSIFKPSKIYITLLYNINYIFQLGCNMLKWHPTNRWRLRTQVKELCIMHKLITEGQLLVWTCCTKSNPLL